MDENIFLSNLSSHRIKQNIIMLIIAQEKAYGPIPAGKHRKSIQHESGIPDRKSPESSGREHCFHFSLISGARNYPPDDKQISAIYVLYWHGFKCSVEYMICSAKLNIKKSVNWMNAK